MKRAAVLALALLPACEVSEAPPRAQLLVVVDTDAPVLEQVRTDPSLSAAVAVDTVRIDLLDESGGIRVYREFSGTSPLDWPLSFAIVPGEVGGEKTARLRVRAFRARDAIADVVNGASTLSPPQELALDRVVELALPSSNTIDTRRVFLPANCFGRPVSFRDRTSCAPDGASREPFAAPVPAGARGTSSVGTWPRAHERPCPAPAPAGRVCVPGGISTLGNERAIGYEDGIISMPAIPVRLVELEPFYMDRDEFTIGRLRRWMSRLADPPTPRQPPSAQGLQFCTLSDDERDDLPVNCVSEDTARQLCELEGGALPTEAQWNHAAGGRGDGRLFPWGDQEPDDCCMLSAGRVALVKEAAYCKDAIGPEPVSSHQGAGCSGPGDVSRDGVLDLGGGMEEILRDQVQPLDDPCWGDAFGILAEATCPKRTGIAVGARGGTWNAGPFQSLNGLRKRVADRTSALGFRCVYSTGDVR